MARLSEQDIRKFRDRVRIARKMQDERKPHYERMVNYYRGKHDIRIEKPLDHVTVNYMLPMVEIKVAALAAQPPVWRFTADDPAHEARALLWDSIMPGIWRRIGAHRQMRLALKDSKIFGFGVVQTAYRFETNEDLFMALLPSQLEKVRGGEDPGLDFPAELVEMNGQTMARNLRGRILYDDVAVERVSPRRFFPDPEVDWENLHRADWIVHQTVQTLEAVKKSKRYSGARDLQGDRIWEMGEDKIYPRPEQDDQRPESRSRVTLWTVYDRRENVFATFAQERDAPMEVAEFPYEFEGYPFEAIGTYVVPDTLYPLGDVEIATTLQDEKNLLRSRAATRIRRLVDKYGIDVNAITDGTLEALESDQEGAIVKLATPPTPQTLQLLGTRGSPADLVLHERNIDRDFSVVTGQTEYARSVTATGVETATEASILREMAGVRGQDDQGQWDDFQARVGRKVKAIIEEFYDTERNAPIEQDTSAQLLAAGVPEEVIAQGSRSAWIRYTRETLRMSGDVEVEAGSSAFRNRVLEQQRTTQQFAPLWNHPLVDQEKLVKIYISKATDFGMERDELVISKEQMAMAQQAMQGQAGAEGAAPAEEGLAPQGTDESLTRAAAALGRPEGGI